MAVDMPDFPNLNQVNRHQGCVNEIRGGLTDKPHAGGREFPGQQSQRQIQRNVHEDVQRQIAAAGDFHGAGLFRFEVGGALGRVADDEVIDNAIGDGGDTGYCEGDTPAGVVADAGGDEGQRHRRAGRAEVAPAAVDALGETGLAGGKPFADHADADHKTRADKAGQEAQDGELFIAVRPGEGDADQAAQHQDAGVHNARSQLVHQHAHHDAGGNGHGDIENQQDFGLLVGEVQRFFDEGHHWPEAQPYDKGHEKREPGVVQGSDVGLAEIKNIEIVIRHGMPLGS